VARTPDVFVVRLDRYHPARDARGLAAYLAELREEFEYAGLRDIEITSEGKTHISDREKAYAAEQVASEVLHHGLWGWVMHEERALPVGRTVRLHLPGEPPVRVVVVAHSEVPGHVTVEAEDGRRWTKHLGIGYFSFA
jgi:hypothetical protein